MRLLVGGRVRVGHDGPRGDFGEREHVALRSRRKPVAGQGELRARSLRVARDAEEERDDGDERGDTQDPKDHVLAINLDSHADCVASVAERVCVCECSW